MRGTLTSSSFSSLSFITPTPSHFFSLTLVFSVIKNKNLFFYLFSTWTDIILDFIVSRSHTQPSHSQISRLLTSSLSLGVPVSRGNNKQKFGFHSSRLFHFRRASFSSQVKKVGSTLGKDKVLRVNLNLDGEPITSRTHTHPSHSQTSRLLTSSLSLGVSAPRTTQCVCQTCRFLNFSI